MPSGHRGRERVVVGESDPKWRVHESFRQSRMVVNGFIWDGGRVSARAAALVRSGWNRCSCLLPAGCGRCRAGHLYAALGASGVAARVVGVRVHRPIRSLPWYLMSAGLLLWVIGDAVDSWFEDVDHVSPFPSAADGFLSRGLPGAGLGTLAAHPRTSAPTGCGEPVGQCDFDRRVGFVRWQLSCPGDACGARHPCGAVACRGESSSAIRSVHHAIGK